MNGAITSGDSTYGVRRYGESINGIGTAGDRTHGDKTAGFRSNGEKTFGDRTCLLGDCSTASDCINSLEDLPLVQVQPARSLVKKCMERVRLDAVQRMASLFWAGEIDRYRRWIRGDSRLSFRSEPTTPSPAHGAESTSKRQKCLRTAYN